MRVEIAALMGFDGILSTVLVKGEYILRGSKADDPYEFLDVPDYPRDLNACAEMEKTLTEEQLPIYAHHLAQITVHMLGSGWWDQTADEVAKIAHATALQRCEAFCRVKGIYHD
jgi:hypothetical protein